MTCLPRCYWAVCSFSLPSFLSIFRYFPLSSSFDTQLPLQKLDAQKWIIETQSNWISAASEVFEAFLMKLPILQYTRSMTKVANKKSSFPTRLDSSLKYPQVFKNTINITCPSSWVFWSKMLRKLHVFLTSGTKGGNVTAHSGPLKRPNLGHLVRTFNPCPSDYGNIYSFRNRRKLKTTYHNQNNSQVYRITAPSVTFRLYSRVLLCVNLLIIYCSTSRFLH